MREALTDMKDGQKEILLATPLFCGIAAADAEALLACLAPTLRHVPRDGTVLAAGDAPRFVGVLLAGEVHIVHDDYWGNRSILSAVLPGDVFGEAFALGAAPCAAFGQQPPAGRLPDALRGACGVAAQSDPRVGKEEYRADR